MTIEEGVFRCKSFREDGLHAFGFEQSEKGWVYETAILDGAFRVRLELDGHGQVHGHVIDAMNEEEYLQLRNERFDGAYVNSVRFAYEELLKKIAAACCSDVLFTSEQANRIAEAIRKAFGVVPDFPWSKEPEQSGGVFRHAGSRKWFGLIMRIRRNRLPGAAGTQMVDVMNLKIRPDQSEEALATPGIFPAYHMNKKYWISVILDDTLDDGTVMKWIQNSYDLTSGC